MLTVRRRLNPAPINHTPDRKQPADADQARHLETTLAHMDQGLLMIDRDGVVAVCNDRVRDLLGLPNDMPIIGHSFDSLVAHQWKHQEFAAADITMIDFVQMGGITRSPPVYERQRPNGTTLEIRTSALADGSYVRTYTDITARRAAEGSLRTQATTDDLTALANRTTFRRHIESAMDLHTRHGQAFALLYLDLDRFKIINDTLGHQVGDRLLVAVADRLRAQARPIDTVARLGGDEFAILVNETEHAAPERLAERLIRSISQPYTIEGQLLEVGVSIGIAVISGASCTVEKMIQHADLALYKAKKDGRSRYCTHIPSPLPRHPVLMGGH